jgi:hypothetical protein
MGIMISIGRWGNVYTYKGFGWRICLGWIAITFFPVDGDQVLDFAGKWASHLLEAA